MMTIMMIIVIMPLAGSTATPQRQPGNDRPKLAAPSSSNDHMRIHADVDDAHGYDGQ